MTGSRVGFAAKTALVWLAIFGVLAPLLWMLDTSFMTRSEALSVPPHWVPHAPTFRNYLAFVNPHRWGGEAAAAASVLGPSLMNSAIVAVVVALVSVCLGGSAAYALARYTMRGGNGLLVFYILTRLVPPVALMIPVFLMFSKLGLLSNLGSVVIVDCGVTIPFVIWVLRSYFMNFPKELEEAAWVDGATWLQAVRHIVVPVVAPALVAAAVFAFITSWGDFVYATMLLRNPDVQTVPLTIAQLASGERIDKGILTAAGIIAVIPPLVFALIFQRYIVAGLGSGATKG